MDKVTAEDILEVKLANAVVDLMDSQAANLKLMDGLIALQQENRQLRQQLLDRDTQVAKQALADVTARVKEKYNINGTTEVNWDTGVIKGRQSGTTEADSKPGAPTTD